MVLLHGKIIMMAFSNTCLCDSDYCIIASLSHYEEIKENLLELGMREEKNISLKFILSEVLLTKNAQEEMNSEAKEIEIWNWTRENYEQLMVHNYTQDFKELMKQIS